MKADFKKNEFMRNVEKIDTGIYEISANFRHYMNKPARFYMTKKVLQQAEVGAIQQTINITTLPGLVKYSIALPDMHWGYGFPIGGVAAFDPENDGVISPGGVGFDINCGVRHLTSNLTMDDVEGKLNDVLEGFKRQIPAGVGREGHLDLSREEIDEVSKYGAKWVVEQGYGRREDLKHIEDGGVFPNADPSKVSRKAKNRGRSQLGTLGSGNHYIELEVVDEIYDEKIAKRFGVFQEGQIGLMIHSGSRGFGHQICTDYAKHRFPRVAKKHDIKLRDKQLAAAPFNSRAGQDYYGALNCGINYAFANRQVLMHFARKALKNALGTEATFDLLYGVCHNTAKVEEHTVNGKNKELVVHRKGATRGFGPQRKEIPGDFRDIGQPVLVGGTMQTGSRILIGTDRAMEEVWGSSVHGAGRTMSRRKAKHKWWGGDVKKRMRKGGIMVDSANPAVLAEETKGAYKNVDGVVNAAEKTGITRKIFSTRPLVVWKG